jgi:hypothetical protein
LTSIVHASSHTTAESAPAHSALLYPASCRALCADPFVRERALLGISQVLARKQSTTCSVDQSAPQYRVKGSSWDMMELELTPMLFFVTTFLETSAIKCLLTFGCGRSDNATQSLTGRMSATDSRTGPSISQGEARGRSDEAAKTRMRVQSVRYLRIGPRPTGQTGWALH